MGKKFRGGGRASLFSLYIESEDGSGGGGELLRDMGWGVDFKALRRECGENLIWSGCEVQGQPSAWMAFRFCIFLCSNIFDICIFACSI